MTTVTETHLRTAALIARDCRRAVAASRRHGALAMNSKRLAVADQNGDSLPPTVMPADGSMLYVPMLDHFFRGAALLSENPRVAAFPTDCENLLFSLHTASPIEGNHIARVIYKQTRHEITAPGYRRAHAARDSDNWIISQGRVATKLRIGFQAFRDQAEPITHLGIGAEIDGKSVLLFAHRLKIPFVADETIEPYFAPGDLVVHNPLPIEMHDDAFILVILLRNDCHDDWKGLQVTAEVEYIDRFGNRHNFSPRIEYKGRDGRKR